MRVRPAVAVALVAVGILAAPSGAHPGHDRNPRAMHFDLPSRVTPDLAGGFDPDVAVDGFGNIVVTAAKDDAMALVAPDTTAVPPVRAASWRWVSVDEGKSWKNLPGLAGGVDNLVPGLEPDVAVDGKGVFYVVDGSRVDLSLTEYDVKGRDRITRRDGALPVRPTARLDTKPFVAAHGDGVVIAISAADPINDPVAIGDEQGTGFGPGRYVVYGYDLATTTVEPTGYPLKDSVTCRPAAEAKRGSKRFAVACLDGMGTVYAYVSTDDAKTFQRYAVSRYVATDPRPGHPSVTFAPDGTMHILISEGVVFDADGTPTATRLKLFSSKDGARWRTRDVTDAPGIYRQASISAGPDGRLGVAAYYRPNTDAKWNVVAGSFRPTERTVYLTAFAHDEPVAEATAKEPPGSYLSLTWSAQRRMHVTWTRTHDAASSGVLHEVWHSRSLAS